MERREDLKIKKGAKKRIGLFGGTFNPIHLGHLRGAEEIREAFELQQVIFIPAAIPPHKLSTEVIEAKHRLEMVKLAIASNPFFSTTDVELSRPEKSYSVDTIRYFRETYSDAFFFILGRDAFVEIETWREFQHLFSLCNSVVMTHHEFQNAVSIASLPKALGPVFRHDPESKSWIHTSGHTLSFKEISYLNISSTKVRELIESGKSVIYLIPDEVGDYIKRNGLYRHEPCSVQG